MSKITKEKKRININFRNSEMRFRRLFETAQDGILILDAKTGQIREVNPFLVDILGYSRQELLGKKLWEIGTFTDIAKSKEAFETIQQEGYVRYENIPLQTKEGLLIRVEFVSNMYLVDGEEVVQCNIRDITERKKMEAIVEQRRVILEQQLKSELIADITHELRTPLSIIRGNIDLADANKFSSTSTTKVYKAINEEVSVLADMLADLTFLTSDKNELQRRMNSQKVNLTSLLKQAVERVKSITHDKKISIQVAKICEVNIMGDRVLVEKLFLNIIKNAVAYGRSGGRVDISCLIKGQHVNVSIKDNGIGISKENLPSIFDRFYRVDKSRTRNEGGTGLGLSISKWIVQAHKGRIQVKSVEKRGSTFTITFPIIK